MFDDGRKPGVEVVVRGFIGTRQAVEYKFQVGSMRAAWDIASEMFGIEAKQLECDRYTVDTYWVY